MAQVDEKTKTLQPDFLHHLEQLDGLGGVVLVVFERIGHRFADIGVGGEVDDRAESVLGEERAHEFLVAHVADDQFDRRINDRPLVAEYEIVEHHDFPPLAGEQANGVGADVTSSSGDENRCVGWDHEIDVERKPKKPPLLSTHGSRVAKNSLKIRSNRSPSRAVVGA